MKREGLDCTTFECECSEKPQISVIIPIFNNEKTIEPCIRSIKDQSFTGYELICVDDGSTDSGMELLKKLDDDNRIRIIKSEHKGPSSARNKGLDEALGKYIIFVDADDILPKDSLKIRYEAIQGYHANFMTFSANVVNESDEAYPLWIDLSVKSVDLEIKKPSIRKILAIPSLKPFMWTSIFNRTYLLDNKISFNESLSIGEDQAFMLQCAMNTDRIITKNKIVYEYHFKKGSKSCIDSDNAEKELKKIIEMITYILKNMNKNIGYLDKKAVTKWINNQTIGYLDYLPAGTQIHYQSIIGNLKTLM